MPPSTTRSFRVDNDLSQNTGRRGGKDGCFSKRFGEYDIEALC